MARVFISYRRDDSAGHAGRVHDRLEREFGRDLLFMDVDSVPLGVNFVNVLREAVAKCDTLLAVIGPHWLEARDDDGGRRLDNPHDFVRVEIAAALQRDIPVIPILLDGTRLPRAESLPEDLRELPMRNALDVRHASFHHDMDKLIRTLRGDAAGPGAADDAPAQTPPMPDIAVVGSGARGDRRSEPAVLATIPVIRTRDPRININRDAPPAPGVDKARMQEELVGLAFGLLAGLLGCAVLVGFAVFFEIVLGARGRAGDRWSLGCMSVLLVAGSVALLRWRSHLANCRPWMAFGSLTTVTLLLAMCLGVAHYLAFDDDHLLVLGPWMLAGYGLAAVALGGLLMVRLRNRPPAR